jgi:hypothetical protein
MRLAYFIFHVPSLARNANGNDGTPDAPWVNKATAHKVSNPSTRHITRHISGPIKTEIPVSLKLSQSGALTRNEL